MPVLGPDAVGVKVTVMVQLLLPLVDGSAKGQLSVSAKSPVVMILPMLRGAVPVFVRTTFWPALVLPITVLGKAGRGFGDRLTTGSVPVPVTLTDCGLPLALSVIVSVPVRVPVVVGVKVTLMLQVPPAATEPLQLLVWAKSPVIAILLTLKGPVPVLPSVTICGALFV